jgi:radical SAM protein with 4Fe4S-binding SPASM domain
MEGIERLRSRGITLRLKSVAMRQNFEWLSDVEEFAEGIGATYRFDSAIIPQLDLSQEPLETRLSATEIVALDMASPKRVENFLELAKMKSPATFDRVFNCGGGRRAFSVNPYGQMSICPFAQYDSYDLRSGTLAEGWCDFIPQMLTRRPTTENPCPTCDLLWLCHRCAAKSYLESGHEEAKIPFWCEVAEMRRHALAPLMSAEDIAPPRSPSATGDTRQGTEGR